MEKRSVVLAFFFLVLAFWLFNVETWTGSIVELASYYCILPNGPGGFPIGSRHICFT